MAADVFGDFLRDGVDFADALWKVGSATGGPRDVLDGPGGSLGRAAVFFTQQANCVNDRVAFLQPPYEPFQIEHTGVVFTVGDDQQNLLVPFGLLIEVVERHAYGIVKRGAAAGVNPLQGVLQPQHVAGERTVEEALVIEIDDEDFVFRIRRFDEIDSGGIHLAALIPHASAVVDQNAEGDGDVFPPEVFELLQNFLFIDLEGALRQVRDEMATAVQNRGM